MVKLDQVCKLGCLGVSNNLNARYTGFMYTTVEYDVLHCLLLQAIRTLQCNWELEMMPALS
jgi:hypothetical protein